MKCLPTGLLLWVSSVSKLIKLPILCHITAVLIQTTNRQYKLRLREYNHIVFKMPIFQDIQVPHDDLAQVQEGEVVQKEPLDTCHMY